MIPDRLAFIDLETTGANPAHDRITEIGVVVVDNGEVSTWNTLVNPERAIPEFIQQLTGIRNDMVAGAPTFAEVAEELAALTRGRLFIAHNARFDYGFVKQEFQRLGRRFRADVLCTVRLSRALFPEHHRHNLDSLIARHGLASDDRHRALADADLIWQFWREIGRLHSADCIAEAVAQQLKRPSFPPHLDAGLLDDLPDTPGVYLFYGENDVPLYVGKSVNLRQRVFSHFGADTREYKAMRLTQEVRRIDWRETIGELGALLLESRLVKQLRPLHNRRLRPTAELCAWQLAPGPGGEVRPRLVDSEAGDFGRADDLYGLYATPREARNALRKIADAHGLCAVVLGLDKPSAPGRACFAHQVGKCRGACAGKEKPAVHGARLMAALAKLKLPVWPYPGPVGIVERNAFLDLEDVHVVDAWRYLGTVRSDADVDVLLESAGATAFDADTYKLLKSHLAKGRLEVRRLRRR